MAILPTRRSVLKAGALGVASASTLAVPFVHGAYAAGKLSCGFWDHWVPGANDALKRLCHQWADKEKVDISLDFITNNGDKLLLTIAGEADARSGHDVLQIPDWYAAAQADNLEPVDDIVGDLIAKYGKVSEASEYIGKQHGHWIAVPSCILSTALVPCARIDLMQQYAGIDVTKMYPAGPAPTPDPADNWTWDAFLDAAEKCFKGGHPFGMPLGNQSDSVNWVGAVFASYGAELVDKDGNVTVKSDATKQVLEWFQKLVPFLPPDVFSWDNASNNKALISGNSALIMNPPSAWAVAKQDAPDIAAKLWTFHAPKGPKGRYDPGNFGFWGIWNFSANVAAAKSLLTYLSQRDSVGQLVAAGNGYDLPQFEKLHDFPTWADEGPPKGTLYNYPPRGDVISLLAGFPAPVAVGTLMFAQETTVKMVTQCTQEGKSIDDAIAWAAAELRGFTRT